MGLIEQVKRHEGLRLKPYKCSAGKLTIGYGRNIEDNGITESEADMMLATDLSNSIREVQANIDLTHCNKARRAVLANMCFNMGINRLLKFVKTIRFIERGAFKLASEEMMDSVWAEKLTGRASELSRQMLTGEFSE